MKKVLVLLVFALLLSFTAAVSASADPWPPWNCDDSGCHEPNNTRETAYHMYWFKEDCHDSDIECASWTLYSDMSSRISSSADEDWFYFYEEDHTHLYYENIRLTSPNGADYDFYVYDHNGNLVGSATSTWWYDEISTPAGLSLSNGYYVKVVGKNGSHNANRNYELRLYTDFIY